MEAHTRGQERIRSVEDIAEVAEFADVEVDVEEAEDIAEVADVEVDRRGGIRSGDRWDVHSARIRIRIRKCEVYKTSDYIGWNPRSFLLQAPGQAE